MKEPRAQFRANNVVYLFERIVVDLPLIFFFTIEVDFIKVICRFCFKFLFKIVPDLCFN